MFGVLLVPSEEINRVIQLLYISNKKWAAPKTTNRQLLLTVRGIIEEKRLQFRMPGRGDNRNVGVLSASFGHEQVRTK